ncbi:low molecular weight phosphotyrosine protein phosphatase, partial [Plakobranchus ocellatus]
NICRSTMAEAILSHLLTERKVREKWKVDSAGHGDWHLGKPPEERTLQVLARHSITDYTHTARLITEEDFFTSDYILCMDDYNLEELEAMKPVESQSVLWKLGDFDLKGARNIFDPYYSNTIEIYEKVYTQCYRCCEAFLDYALKN